MNGRMFDPLLGRFLSPDPYVQMPDFSQNFNRYAYCLNNPLVYTDPSGEFLWLPVIVGAVIGGVSGAMIGHANGSKGWNMVSYIAGGALIGGLSGGSAAGISAAGGSAWWAGAAAGVISGAGFSGLATDWNPEAMINGAWKGALSGFVGGGIGSAIGGGWGAVAGGAASNLTNQLLYNDGDFSKINWLSVGISGAVSFGLYHGMQFAQYKMMGGQIGGQDVTYRQFSKINTAYQRSRFWRREFGVYLNEDGSAKITPWKDSNKYSVKFSSKQGNINKTMHAHWAKKGVDIEGGYETVGGYHSPDDMALFRGTSFVVGRTTSSYLTHSMGGWKYIYPDPFVRFFLFPFLGLK
ncbi:MAG: hypothetical protein LBD59_07525 [Prevotellaceae bacterium]|jgi:hypothetical protein|nr:hypothetical protein [Prevotellaceae bacterium]